MEQRTKKVESDAVEYSRSLPLSKVGKARQTASQVAKSIIGDEIRPVCIWGSTEYLASLLSAGRSHYLNHKWSTISGTAS
jgi:hypothetical protein